jgi:TonB family protein
VLSIVYEPGTIRTGGRNVKKVSFAAAITAILIGASLVALAQQTPAVTNAKLSDLLRKGDDLYKAGKFTDAIEVYKTALGEDANNDQAIGYIAYSYNKMGDSAQARDWMKRRVEIPGQSPSKRAQVLTDITLLYWDEAHLNIAASVATGNKYLKPEESANARKLLAEGIDAAQRAVTIAPRSAKGFNLLNLLYRASAATEPDNAVRADLIAKADAALRLSVQFFEALGQPQSADIWSVPTLSAINGAESGQAAHFGAPTRKNLPDALKDAKEGSVAVEVVISRDGKVLLPRVLAGQKKLGDAAASAVRQWEFEPSTFEGHAVQLLETISFPGK